MLLALLICTRPVWTHSFAPHRVHHVAAKVDVDHLLHLTQYTSLCDLKLGRYITSFVVLFKMTLKVFLTLTVLTHCLFTI